MNIIFNGVFGSHLYGLSTPDSDKDYKGVYLPNNKDLIFRNYKESIEKQTKEVDTTLYALPRFINILEKCDTVSFDMIHTPKEFTIESSSLWDKIRSYRSDLYCKEMKGLVGYIRTQASKYGHKVERYDEMVKLLDLFKSLESHSKIEQTTLPEIIERSNFKFIKFNRENKNIKANIDICGSRYQINAEVGYVVDQLNKKIDKYGNRTLKGSLSGGDFKSMSHSLRVLYQMEEIIDTRDLIFPLKYRDIILKVKLGEVSQEDVMNMISDKYLEVQDKLDNSDLPQYNDLTRIKDIVMEEIL